MNELDELKEQIAKLRERVAVLESNQRAPACMPTQNITVDYWQLVNPSRPIANGFVCTDRSAS